MHPAFTIRRVDEHADDALALHHNADEAMVNPDRSAPLLERGVYFAPSAFEVFFASAAHEPAQLRETAAALKEALEVAFK